MEYLELRPSSTYPSTSQMQPETPRSKKVWDFEERPECVQCDCDLGEEDLDLPQDPPIIPPSDAALVGPESATIRRRHFFARSLALLCACGLSIGSHYGSYILGPLKSRLSREMGTSNTQFSLLIASYSLNSTWTPLVGGLLATRLGTAWTSVLATSLIFSGQIILLVGNITETVSIMAFGMFVFGLGISPLSVVQETIIVRFFKSHGLGVSLALGLIAGKGASFIAAETSFPLSETFGSNAPFIVATLLAGFSFAINLLYLSASPWLTENAGVEPEFAELKPRGTVRRGCERLSQAEAASLVAAKRTVQFRDLTKLGDVFWLYIGINFLCGSIWSPFTHLAANIIEKRYSLTESQASQQASLLLAGSVFLYPICGYLTDRVKTGMAVHWLFTLASILTLFCYSWLSAPVEWTHTPIPAMISFGLGHGFSTLLLVLIVPHIVSLRFVPTALGAHKSIEQSGSTISQTIAGLVLDSRRADPKQTANNPIQYILNSYLTINLVQLIGALLLWKMDSDRRQETTETLGGAGYQRLAADPESDQDDDPEGTKASRGHQPEEGQTHLAQDLSPSCQLMTNERRTQGSFSSCTRPLLTPATRNAGLKYICCRAEMASSIQSKRGSSRTHSERRRGELALLTCAAVVVGTWILFLVTAWGRLRTSVAR